MKDELDIPGSPGWPNSTNCRDIPNATSGLNGSSSVGTHVDLQTLDSVDSAISHSQTQVQRLLQYESSLRTHRNTLIPIHRLSDDILVQLFTYCTRLPSQYGGVYVECHWLAFSQVCTRWRNLAINTANLWTCPDFSSVQLAQLMLERARRAPLHVVLETIRGISWAITGVIPHRPLRTVQFRVDLQTEDKTTKDWERLGSLLSAEFTDLTSVELRSRGGRKPIPAVDMGHFYAPNLQILRIKFVCPLSWNPLVNDLSNLTTFKFSPWLQAGPDLQPACVLSILGKMPNLRILKLKEAMGTGTLHIRPPGGFGAARPSVELPYLQELRLDDESRMLEHLVVQLHMPQLTNIDLRGIIRGEVSESLMALSRATRCVVEGAHLNQGFANCVDLSVDYNFRVAVTNRTTRHRVAVGIEDLAVRRFCTETEAYWQALLSIFTLTEVTKFISIVYETDEEFSAFDYWPDVACLPKLETVELYRNGEFEEDTTTNTTMGGLLKALVDMPAARSEQDLTTDFAQPFPALQKVLIDNLNIFRRQPSVGQYHSYVSDLVEAVERRQAQDMLPLTVLLSHCGFISLDELENLPEAIVIKSPCVWDEGSDECDH